MYKVNALLLVLLQKKVKVCLLQLCIKICKKEIVLKKRMYNVNVYFKNALKIRKFSKVMPYLLIE